VRTSGEKLLVQTVDFFTPIVDDPYTFGQIAAANALSDIYAMGATPTFALNIFGFPIKDLPKEVATQILKGGSDKANEAGIPILGGHSVDDKEPKYGMVVNGEVHENMLIRNSGSIAGDALVLTKPIGTGIVSTAIKKGHIQNELEKTAIESMKTLNRDAAKIMQKFKVNAATDITGFGLIGHLIEMCKSSGVSSKLDFKNIPFFPGLEQLASEGLIPSGSKRNHDHVSRYCKYSDQITTTQQLMLSDSQTSGGLLISIPDAEADDYVNAFNSKSEIKARIIGKVTTKSSELVKIY
jgi:selenide,water dikinase